MANKPSGAKKPKMNPFGKQKAVLGAKMPMKRGMGSPDKHMKLTAIKPGDAEPSFQGVGNKTPSSASAGKMKAIGKNIKARKKQK